MKRRIDLTTFRAQRAEIIVARRDILAVKFGDQIKSKIEMPFDNELRDGAKYLTFDVYVNNNDVCSCLYLDFFVKENKTDEPDFFFILGLLPKIKTSVSLPLDALDGSRVFLDRIPGALKFLTHGKNVNLDAVNRFGIRVLKSSGTQRIQFTDMRFTEQAVGRLPKKKPLVDEMGQWITREWNNKVQSEEEMIAELNALSQKDARNGFGAERSRFGGWSKLRFDNGNGYFRTHYDGKHYWLSDPDGYAFFSAGLDCVMPGEGFTNIDPIKTLLPELPDKNGKFSAAYNDKGHFDFAKANLIRAFGDDWYEKWFAIAKNRLQTWGFNTAANWSDLKFCDNAHIPYVFNMKGFPKTEKLIFRDFPDVFSPEYEKNSEIFASQLEKRKNDPYLIGYFLSNEPHWAWGERICVAEDLLRTDSKTETKQAIIKFLSDRYGKAENLSDAWNIKFNDFDELLDSIVIPVNQTEQMQRDLKEFSALMVRRYCEIPSKACRAVDPNHLNLGLRYASIPDKEILSGADVFDVFSFNCYKIDPSNELERLNDLKMPVMIGEYHFGALDAGLPASGLRAVTTQEERGNAYRYYLGRSISMPNCVGAHYFTLNDEPVLGRIDGENYQIGFVNVTGREYTEIADAATETHQQMYDIAVGNIARYDIYPDETDWVAF